MKRPKDTTIEAKKDCRIILNFTHPKTKITYGAGEPLPTDLTETDIQDLILQGHICLVDSKTGENIDTIHRDSAGRFVLSDAEILNLRPNPNTLNFLKKNKLCKNSLLKLKTYFNEMGTKYGVPNNYFLSEIFRLVDEQLKEVI